MSILQLKNITVIYGNPPLLDGVELIVQPGERVCLVGRNGSGKSTLMKVISGDVVADEGQRIVDNKTIIARLEQDPPQTTDVTLYNYVAEGLADVGELIAQFHHQTRMVTEDPSEKEGIKPAGATVWLPYLPEKGIEGMTERQLKTYWSIVMRTVLPKRRRNLGYDTLK